MAKVTALKAPLPGKPLGTFKAEKFSMFDEDDLARYSELRNRGNNPANGIKIEMMREYSRKTVEVEGEGETKIVRTTEEVILVVHYWEKPVARVKGETDDEIAEGKAVLVTR